MRLATGFNLAAFFLLICLFSAAPFAASSSTSPVLIERLPTDYNDFWNAWYVPFMFTAQSLLAQANNLHIEEANDTEPVLILTADERKEFTKSIEGYDKARASLRDAKAWKKDAEAYLLSAEVMRLFGGGIYVGPAFAIYYKEALPRIQTALSFSRTALMEVDEASNLALENLIERTSRLEYMGAGYPGYGGPAAGTYNELRDLLVQANNSVLNATRYPDLARRYAATLNSAKDVQSAFAKGGTSFNNSRAYANAMNYQLAGDDNLLELIISNYREAVLAGQAMEAEYSALEVSVARKLSDKTEELTVVQEKEKYTLVDEYVASEFSPNSSATVTPPSARIRRAAGYIDTPGSEQDAQSQHEIARRTHGAGARYYVGQAIVALHNAEGMIVDASNEISLARKDVQQMLSSAPSKCEAERTSAERALSSFSPLSASDASMKERAQELMDSGYKLEQQADEAAAVGKGGLALSLYSASIAKFRDVHEMLSEKEVYAENKKAVAERALADLKDAITRATKDSVNVDYEADQLEIMQAQMKVADAPLYSSIIALAQTLRQGIIENAKIQYAELEASAASLAADFSSMEGGVMPDGLKDSQQTFMGLQEKYFEQGRLSDSALGSLAQLKYSMQRISSAVDNYKDEAVSKNLALHSTITPLSDAIPLLDTASTSTFSLSLPNDLAFGIDGPATLDVPFPYEVSRADINSKSDNIEDIAWSGGELTLLVDGFDAQSTSSIEFTTTGVPARTTSSSEKILSLSEALLRKEKTVKFTSEPLDSLRARIPLGAQPSKLSASFDGAPVQVSLIDDGALAAEVIMAPVTKGTHDLKLYYEVPNPYTITQSNRKVETQAATTTVSFDLTVTSNGEELSDVPLYFVEATNATLTPNYAHITGLTSAPQTIKVDASPLGVVFSWKAPVLLPGQPQTYAVYYSFENLPAYAQNLYDALAASPSAASAYAARFTAARNLMSAGQYEKAVEDLLALQQEISAPISTNSAPASYFTRFSEEFASFDAEEKDSEGALALLRSLSATSADVVKIAGGLEDVSDLKEKAELSAAKGEYADALGELAKARDKLRGIPLAKQFNSDRSSISKALQSAKSDALKLSVLGATNSTNTTLALLSTSEASLTTASASAALLQWTDAFTSIKDANASLSSALSSLESAELAQINEFQSLLTTYGEKKSNITALLSSLSKALAFTLGTGEVKKARLELPLDIDSIRSSMAADEKTVEAAAKKLSPSQPSSILTNIAEVRKARSSMDSLLSQEGVLIELQKSLEARASASYDNARLSLKQLAELAPKGDKQLSDELSDLSDLLADSRSALDAGRLLDSISLSAYIQSRTSTALERLPASQPQQGLSSELLIIILSLAFIIALVYLFGHRKPPKHAPTLHRLASAASLDSELGAGA